MQFKKYDLFKSSCFSFTGASNGRSFWSFQHFKITGYFILVTQFWTPFAKQFEICRPISTRHCAELFQFENGIKFQITWCKAIKIVSLILVTSKKIFRSNCFRNSVFKKYPLFASIFCVLTILGK